MAVDDSKAPAHKVDSVQHANTLGEKEITSQDKKTQGRVLISLVGSNSHPFCQSQRPGGLMVLSVPITRKGGGKATGKIEATF